MYLDTNSLDFMNPELDFDLPDDGEIMEEMTLDNFRDVDWSDEDEVDWRVNLKI
jgi:hypothetical protein